MAEFDRLTSRYNSWIKALQDNGYRLTQPRLAVIKVLAQSDQALDASTLHEKASEEYPALSLVSVYRTLEKMEDLHLVTRVHRNEHCHAFVAGLEGHQHLMICEQCGKVYYFSGDDIHGLIEKVEAFSGYQVTDHWLQLFGRCPECIS
ncbi:MAG: transcriptional repressor [Anaerolineae bacterium]|nr:transcriptional repressor [Anaerolineae bacterium]